MLVQKHTTPRRNKQEEGRDDGWAIEMPVRRRVTYVAHIAHGGWKRQVELIIGRSVRIAASLPTLDEHVIEEKGKRDKKAKEGRQCGLRGGRSSLRVEHWVDLCQMVDSAVAVAALPRYGLSRWNTMRVTTFGLGIYLRSRMRIGSLRNTRDREDTAVAGRRWSSVEEEETAVNDRAKWKGGKGWRPRGLYLARTTTDARWIRRGHSARDFLPRYIFISANPFPLVRLPSSLLRVLVATPRLVVMEVHLRASIKRNPARFFVSVLASCVWSFAEPRPPSPLSFTFPSLPVFLRPELFSTRISSASCRRGTLPSSLPSREKPLRYAFNVQLLRPQLPSALRRNSMKKKNARRIQATWNDVALLSTVPTGVTTVPGDRYTTLPSANNFCYPSYSAPNW